VGPAKRVGAGGAATEESCQSWLSPNSMSEQPDITIRLSHDEALVLSEVFYRFADTDALTLLHNAEFVALGRISGQLDKLLVEPFLPNYSDLLQAARERIAGDYEGLAPGVTPDATLHHRHPS
jgi:hypothetical protein